jgi:hypothetical protein
MPGPGVQIVIEAIDNATRGIVQADRLIGQLGNTADATAPRLAGLSSALGQVDAAGNALSGSLRATGLDRTAADIAGLTTATSTYTSAATGAAGATQSLTGALGSASGSWRVINSSTQQAAGSMSVINQQMTAMGGSAAGVRAAAQANQQLAASAAVAAGAMRVTAGSNAAAALAAGASARQFTAMSQAVSAVSPQLGAAAVQATTFASAFAGASPALVAAGAGIAAVSANLVVLGAAIGEVKRIADLGEELDKLRQRTGLTASEIDGLRLASKDMNIDFTTITTGLRLFNKNLAEGDPTLARIGITATTTGDALRQLADIFARTADDENKVLVATTLLGRAGDQLIPFLNQGAEAFDRYTVTARELGTGLGSSAELAARADAAFDQLSRAAEGLRNSIGIRLLPYVTSLVEGLGNLVETAAKVANLGFGDIDIAPSPNKAAEAGRVYGEEYTKAVEQAILNSVFGRGGFELPSPKSFGMLSAHEFKPSITPPPSNEEVEFEKQLRDLGRAIRELERPPDFTALVDGFLAGTRSAADLLRATGSVQEAMIQLEAAGGRAVLALAEGLRQASTQTFPDEFGKVQIRLIPPDDIGPLARAMSAALSEEMAIDLSQVDIRGAEDLRRRLEDATRGALVLEQVPVPKAEPLPEDVSFGDSLQSALLEARLAMEEILEVGTVVRESLQSVFAGLEVGIGRVFAGVMSGAGTFRSAWQALWKSVVDYALAQLARIIAAKAFEAIVNILSGGSIGGGGGAVLSAFSITAAREVPKPAPQGRTDFSARPIQVDVPAVPPIAVAAPTSLAVDAPESIPVIAPRSIAATVTMRAPVIPILRAPAIAPIQVDRPAPVQVRIAPIRVAVPDLIPIAAPPALQVAPIRPLAVERVPPIEVDAPDQIGVESIRPITVSVPRIAVTAPRSIPVETPRVIDSSPVRLPQAIAPVAPRPILVAAAARIPIQPIQRFQRVIEVERRTERRPENVRPEDRRREPQVIDQRTFVFPSYNPRDVFLDAVSQGGNMRRAFDRIAIHEARQ